MTEICRACVSEADCCVHQQSFGQRARREKAKESGYRIFSLIRENITSFVINQAGTFNYKTNYEAVNVSHVTQPPPPPPSTTGHIQEVK